MQWRHRAMLAMWRLRAATRAREWHGEEDPNDGQGEATCSEMKEYRVTGGGGEWRPPGYWVDDNGRVVDACVDGTSCDLLATRMLHEVTGVAERVQAPLLQVREASREQHLPSSRGLSWREAPLETAVDGDDGGPFEDTLMAQEQRAARKWSWSGGWRGEYTRRREGRGLEKIRAAAVQRRKWQRYRTHAMGPMTRDGVGPAPVAGLSGEPLADVGERIVLTIEARGRKRRRAQTGLGARLSNRQRFERGEQPDRWGRWAVDRVLEVRRLRQGGVHHLEARVRWRGLDPLTCLPWADTWVERRDEHGLVMNATLTREAREMEERMYGTRVRRRPRPEAAGAPEAEWWRGRTRRSAQREAARPRRRQIQESSDEEGGPSGRQSERLRDVRGRAGGAVEAARPAGVHGRRRRGVAWSDDDDDEEGEASDRRGRSRSPEGGRSSEVDDETDEVRQLTRAPEEGRAAETSAPAGCACEAGEAGGDASGTGASAETTGPGGDGHGSSEAGCEPGGRATDAWQADDDSQRTGPVGARAASVSPIMGS